MFVEKRSELDIRHSVYKGPPFEFSWINGSKKKMFIPDSIQIRVSKF